MKKIKTLIVDDEPLARERLAAPARRAKRTSKSSASAATARKP